jgi:hypothetical protein
MATFATMQTFVSKRLLDANSVAVSVSDVAASLNDAISYWKFRRFWFNESLSINTVTSTGVVPLPPDFLVQVMDDSAVTIEYSNMRYPLGKVTEQFYDGIWLENGFGLPQVYARNNSQLTVYPLPDQNYTVRIRYLKNYNDLIGGNDSNDFTEYANRLICLWALANLSAELRQDEKMEAYYRAAAENEYKNLSIMTNKSNGTGKLTIYSSL